jgi:hypothetical protein
MIEQCLERLGQGIFAVLARQARLTTEILRSDGVSVAQTCLPAPKSLLVSVHAAVPYSSNYNNQLVSTFDSRVLHRPSMPEQSK